jgi:shikimate dehydrogenase
MRKFGLIGYPLGHSFSKKYFAEKFQKENIRDCSYELYPLPDIERLTDLIRRHDLCGLNVTIPHKSEVLRFASYVDSEAKEIGAANVLKISVNKGDVTIRAFNSDVTGIRDTLSPYREGFKKALVLGTGGSSLAVKYVLYKWGVEVTQVSRTAKAGVIRYEDITARLISDHQLIINTTPLGMFPNVESKAPLDYDNLYEKHILFDLVYNPEETAFLRMGKERGCTTLSGLKMLYSQAERSWEIWNDNNL